MKSARDLSAAGTIMWMDEHFLVYPTRGTLTWKKPPPNHPRMMGKEAGSSRQTVNGKNYIHIKRNKMAIKRGWLIFLWVHHRWPKECLDHIDGNSTNDSIYNLREATQTQNAWNHKTRARRIKLPMGVRRIAASGRYQARIGYHKRSITIGAFDTSEAAHRAYLSKRKELYGEFA